MKKIIKILSESNIWGSLLQLVAMLGLILADDAKSILVFGFIYVGACIQLSNSKG